MKLAQESVNIAKREECDLVYLMATGNYSQKIYTDMGFETLRTVKYEHFKDSNGQPVLTKTDPHKLAKIMYLKLTQ